MQGFLFRKTLMPTAHWLERQIDRRREIAFPTVQPQNRGSTTSQTEFDSIRIFLRPQTPDWLSATLRCRRKPRQTRATNTSNGHRVASNVSDSDNFLENLQNLRPQKSTGCDWPVSRLVVQHGKDRGHLFTSEAGWCGMESGLLKVWKTAPKGNQHHVQ